AVNVESQIIDVVEPEVFAGDTVNRGINTRIVAGHNRTSIVSHRIQSVAVGVVGIQSVSYSRAIGFQSAKINFCGTGNTFVTDFAVVIAVAPFIIEEEVVKRSGKNSLISLLAHLIVSSNICDKIV